MMTVLTWIGMILVVLLAIGFFTAGIFAVAMLFTTKDRNPEVVITFAAVGMFCVAAGVGLVCGALALGRNLF